MRNFAINGRFLARRLTGVDRFAIEVTKAIDSLLDTDPDYKNFGRFRIVAPRDCYVESAYKNIDVVCCGVSRGQLWEQVELPLLIRSDEHLLNLCNSGPIFLKKQIVAIHDAATVSVPNAFSAGFKLWYSFLMPRLGRQARRVLTVSQFSKGEILREFGVPCTKVAVVSEGGEHISRVSPSSDALDKFRLTGKPFILAVSSMAEHKNFRLVLEAISRIPDPPFDVAIAGGANARVFGNSGFLESDSVRLLGYVSDSELRALYENALAFVFPSIYEGFGIPPLEAMVCGCPVLASTAASIPEVCGDAALYFDPRSSEELAALMLKIASDETLRMELRDRGYRRSQQFSWDLGARQVLKVCAELGSLR